MKLIKRILIAIRFEIKKSKEYRKLKLIHKIVCDIYGADRKQSLSKSRESKNVLSRHMSQWFAKELTTLTLKEIGEFIGNVSHSNVSNSCKSIDNAIKYNKDFENLIEKIRIGISQKLIK
jgi:chromosomal replication initiator protein